MAQVNIKDAITSVVKKYLISFGKSMVDRFYTKTDIDTKIEDLNNRSTIGSQLDYGLFFPTNFSNLVVGSYVNFDKVCLNKNIVQSGNYFILKANKTYKIKSYISGKYIFGITNVDDGTQIGQVSYGYSNVTDATSNVAIGSITTTKDTKIGLKIVDITPLPVKNVYPQFSFIEIEETARTVIIDPSEDAKKIQFEYGTFKLSADPVGLATNSIVPFDTVVSGNMILTNNKVLLKANKTYKIETVLRMGTSPAGAIIYRIYDYTNNEYINDFWGLSQKESVWAQQPVLIGRITPTTDIKVGIIIQSIIGCDTISNQMCFLDIQEIAQPYYFNYYKDSISSTVLFDGNGDTTGENYNLLDDISNYNQLLIYASLSDGSVTSMTVDASSLRDSYSIGCFLNTDYYYNIRFNVSGKKFHIIDKWVSNNWSSYNFKIFKIAGIGYNYENPYHDVVTSIESFTITDVEVDVAIKDIWNEVSI